MQAFASTSRDLCFTKAYRSNIWLKGSMPVRFSVMRLLSQSPGSLMASAAYLWNQKPTV